MKKLTDDLERTSKELSTTSVMCSACSTEISQKIIVCLLWQHNYYNNYVMHGIQFMVHDISY